MTAEMEQMVKQLGEYANQARRDIENTKRLDQMLNG